MRDGSGKAEGAEEWQVDVFRVRWSRMRMGRQRRREAPGELVLG